MYNTEIKTVTSTKRVTTQHTDYFDWDYNFQDPKHTSCMCCDAESKKAEIQNKISYLKNVEESLKKNTKCYASNYGGWPRIWQEVIGIGMVSDWPYWEPRPCVLVHGTLGAEWYDWYHITGVRVEVTGL